MEKLHEILDALIKFVDAAELAFPGKGRGQEKLDFVQKLLTSLDANFAQFTPLINMIIAGIVLFRKKRPA